MTRALIASALVVVVGAVGLVFMYAAGRQNQASDEASEAEVRRILDEDWESSVRRLLDEEG